MEETKMFNRPEERKMSPQTNIEETAIINQPEETNMSPQANHERQVNDVESSCDRSCINRCKLTKKRWLILFILIAIIFGIAIVTCAVVYYPREKIENSLQENYENRKKLLYGLGCSPKPKVYFGPSLYHEKYNTTDYEIEERNVVIHQCNDNNSFCGVNGNCTCKPTENGQTNATTIIKVRNRHIKNAKWELVELQLNIMNHTECAGIAA